MALSMIMMIGDDTEEFSTPISLEDTSMTTEFTDVLPKDNTLIPPEVTPMITRFVDVFSEDQVDEEACKGEDIARSCIRQRPSIYLPVFSTIFSLLGEKTMGEELRSFTYSPK